MRIGDGDDRRRLKVASVRVRAHRQQSFAVYNRDSRHGDPRRAGVGGPGGTTMTRTFVPQLARTHTHVGPRAPSLFRRCPSRTSFREWAPLLPDKRARARHATAYARRRI